MHFAIRDFLLDLVQNSVEAGARNVRLDIEEAGGWISAAVEDDGKGMDEAELERAKDPFGTDGKKHPNRKVGLGIPFLIQAAEQAGGDWSIESAKGRGTRVSFRFPEGGLDTPPMGDLPGLFLSVMCFDGDYELTIWRRDAARGLEYELRRSELIEAAGDLSDAGSLSAIREFLASQEA